MNRSIVFLCALGVSLSAIAVPGCSKTSSSASSSDGAAVDSGLPDRDPALAKKLVDEGGLLIDVRSKAEWDDGHIEGAIHIPVGELEARLSEVDKFAGGDKAKPVVVYCQSGGRAGQAKKVLLKAGHSKVTNMGGMSDWPKIPAEDAKKP